MKTKTFYRFRLRDSKTLIIPDTPHEIWDEEVVHAEKDSIVGSFELTRKQCQDSIKDGIVATYQGRVGKADIRIDDCYLEEVTEKVREIDPNSL